MKQGKKIERLYYRLSDAVKYLEQYGIQCNEADLLHLGSIGELEFITNKPKGYWNDGFFVPVLTYENLPRSVKDKDKQTTTHPSLIKLYGEYAKNKKALEYEIGEFTFFNIPSSACMMIELCESVDMDMATELFNDDCEPISPPESHALPNGNIQYTYRTIVKHFIHDFDLGAGVESTEQLERLAKIKSTYTITKEHLLITHCELNRFIENKSMTKQQNVRVHGTSWSEIVRTYALEVWAQNKHSSIKQLSYDVLTWCDTQGITNDRGNKLTIESISRHALQNFPKRTVAKKARLK